MMDAIFVQGERIIFIPALIIGMCLGSLIFLVAERKVITGKIWITFVMCDLSWIGVALRRIQIIDQSDVVVVIEEFFIVCLLMCATVLIYQEKRKKIIIGRIKAEKENEIEMNYRRARSAKEA